MRKILATALIVVTWVFMFSVPSVIAQGETGDCYGNFDCDLDVDGEDLTKFLSSFARGQYDRPCPSCLPIKPILKTGQTVCYDEFGGTINCAGTGQDGEYQKGMNRFTDNGDGTVTDNLRGLIWLKNADCFGSKLWNLALSDCNGLSDGQCGLTDGSSVGDWRLPNISELQALGEDSSMPLSAFIGEPFINIQSSAFFWSSTTNPSILDHAFAIHQGNGVVSYGHKTTPYNLLPVRDPL